MEDAARTGLREATKVLWNTCNIWRLWTGLRESAITPRRNFYAVIRDAACQAYMVTHSRNRQLLDGMKYAHFPQQASGSTYIHVEPVLDSWNFKLKKLVDLTTMLTKELDSIIEEVEFWQEKYEEAMKTIWKLKHHCPQGVETLSEEEMEEFTPASPPRKMATRAPPVYIIPNNDEDYELLLLDKNIFLV
jgi:hypothetical protein